MYNQAEMPSNPQSSTARAFAELLALFTEAEYPVQVLYNQGLPIAHFHPEIEFSIVLRGRGECFVRDQAYELEPGAGLIVHADEVHYGIPNLNPDMLRAVLIFDLSLVLGRPAARQALDDLGGRTYFILSSSELTTVEFLLKDIADELVARGQGWRDIVECNLERFLLIVSRSDPSRAPARVRARDAQLVREVVGHLEKTFAEKQSVDAIARRFGVSRSLLQRAFKQYTGFGVKEFTIRLRVVEAKRLLGKTDLKVATVAYEVGFENLSAFNRDFRLHTGVSPSSYRSLTRLK